MRPPPPAIWTALLTRATANADSAEEIVGDLHEEFSDVAAARGTLYAQAWYAWQAARIAAGALVRRPAASRVDQRPFTNPGDPPMRTLVPDVRHAVRTLLKRPALTALVVVTLGLGLGANAAIFQVIDALILRPFTMPDQDRIVMVAETGPNLELDVQETVSPANYLDWKKQLDVFEHLSASEWWDVNFAGTDEAERVQGFFVTSNFFPALGVDAALGRTFTTDEEVRGNHRRVVLSHDLWQRRFGGQRAVVGTAVLLDGEPYEVVGVMPAGFAFPLGTAVWAPLAFDAKTAARRDARYLTVIGRLAPGKSLDDAKTQVAVVAQRLEAQYPDTNNGRGARAVTLVEGMRDQGLGSVVSLWQAAAAFVLLIGCANIANLLLARGTERQREVAVRSALGATRGRIVRELLIESTVLALLAVPVALAVAWAGITLIRVNLPASLVRFVAGWQTLDVDVRLILFTTVLAIVTALIFGLVPALRASRPVLSETLKDGGRSGTAGRGRQRVRSALVVAEIALALPLLVASALSVIGAHRFLNGPQGYEPQGLLSMRSILPDATYETPQARRRFVEEVERRFAQLPGVRSVGVSNVLPATSNNASRVIEVEGTAIADPANAPRVDFRAVRPAFLETMGTPVIRGRGILSSDTAESQPVAVISQSAAERHFPGTDPVGRRIKLGDGSWVTVVGVCGDTIHNWFARRNAPTVYVPYDQAPTSYLAIAIRAEGDLASLVPPVRAAVRDVDPAQPIFDVLPMGRVLHERTIGLQYVAAIMAVFGGLALLLAVVGVYSVMAFVITQRTQEIGVRIALGAKRADVLRLTIGQAASMTAIGIAFGLALSYLLSRLMEAALFGTVTADARVSISLAIVLVTAAIAAGYVPARRATAIDPVIALRR